MINKSNYSFQIDLPSYTDKKVIEWFESLSNLQRLSEEVIALVFEHINATQDILLNINYQQEGNLKRPETDKIKPETKKSRQESNNSTNQEDDFFNNLYNWQESNNMIHKEENKREKKKMLSV